MFKCFGIGLKICEESFAMNNIYIKLKNLTKKELNYFFFFFIY